MTSREIAGRAARELVVPEHAVRGWVAKRTGEVMGSIQGMVIAAANVGGANIDSLVVTERTSSAITAGIEPGGMRAAIKGLISRANGRC